METSHREGLRDKRLRLVLYAITYDMIFLTCLLTTEYRARAHDHHYTMLKRLQTATAFALITPGYQYRVGYFNLNLS